MTKVHLQDKFNSSKLVNLQTEDNSYVVQSALLTIFNNKDSLDLYNAPILLLEDIETIINQIITDRRRDTTEL